MLLIITASIILLIKALKSGKRNNDYDPEGGFIAILIIIAIIFSLGFQYNAVQIVKIKIAPRVFIIDYLKGK